ncbi:hypothetical protein P3S68_012048 [Capsicum galapagoense]
MKLLTGWMALDEDRSNGSQYLVAWNIKSSKEKLIAAIDPVLDVKQESTLDSIYTVAEPAGHCTAREPGQRPDMSHVVNIFAPLVEKWKPLEEDTDNECGIDYSFPLNQMVKAWQQSEGKDLSCIDLEESKQSNFAESFTSV